MNIASEFANYDSRLAFAGTNEVHIRDNLKQKLHLWRKRDIQRRCEYQAHRKRMRVSRICAWNTSRLAYDGSGAVTRDWENHSLCTFQTGKRYNCDLSASYNII